MSAEALAERVFERLAEDERLRGNMTDAAYGPLLDWAAARALALAPSVVLVHDDAAEWLASRLRRGLAELVAAAQTGQPRNLAALRSIAGRRAVGRVVRAMAQSPDPVTRAAAMAAALAPPASSS